MTLPALREFEHQLMPDILPEADMSDWEELADEPIDSVFDTGLVAGTMGLLIAPGGTGKSYLALQLALSVALGRALLPRFTPIRRGSVLCCFGEDDRSEMSRRLKAVCTAHKIPPKDVTEAIRAGRLRFNLGKAEALLQFNMGGSAVPTEAHKVLSRRCTESEFRLVIIDPIVGWAGVPNENDNSQMQLAAQALIDLAKASGGAVLGVHHQGKNSARGRETTVATGRGATSLTDASRWQATLQPVDAKKAGITEAEAPRYLELHVGKNSYFQRDGRPLYLERVGAALVAVDLSAKPEEIISALARSLAVKIGANEASMPKWALLQDAPGKEFRRELKAEHGPTATRDNLVKAYQLAVDLGWLSEDSADSGGGDNAKIPRIPDEEEAE